MQVARLRTVLLFTLLAFGFLVSNTLPAADKRSITETDLFQFNWIADPQISPDGSQVAFVKVSANQKKDGYDTSLWLVATSGLKEPRPLTAGPRDLSPRWSPEGKSIAFIRAAEKEGKPQPAQIYILSMEGGEARPITDLSKGTGSPVWSPEGKTIVFTSATSREDDKKRSSKKSEDKPEGTTDKDQIEPHESDVRVITRAVYRFNGAGYLDPKRHTHIWTITVPEVRGKSVTPQQLTSGSFDESNPTWSPDGSRIYFTSNRVAEPYYEPPHNDLYSIPRDGGEMVKLAGIDGVIGEFAFSPDGKWIAFRGTLNGHPVRSYSQPDLFVVENTVGATPKNLTAEWDFDIGSGITSDQHAPRGSQPSEVIWSKDGMSILVVAAEYGRANIKRVDVASGRVEPVTAGDHEVIAYTASADVSKMALLISDPASIGDIFVVEIGGRGAVPNALAANGVAGADRSVAPRNVGASSSGLSRLTRVNEDLFSKLNLSAPEEIWYTSFDGKKIQGWIQKPPGFDPSKKYPMILEIHGGPHAAYGCTFTHEFQWMAAKGYVVLYVNPRGSTSYGQDFGNIIQHHYPGDDYKDLMAGLDELVKRGYIDPAKVGVTGGSGGGLLTNWVVTQTDRFAAAVSQRSISDWASFWYAADFTLFTPSWFKGPPWQDPKDYAARSPITFIERVKTPMMFIEGEVDYRTPPADGGEQMFRALKFRRIPTAMVRFPDESHELSRSGKPWHRVERLQHILNWFDKYLQGKPIDIYEVK
jgi:dipeptidyl aminopeptidase/acylaminoacyl peptidase